MLQNRFGRSWYLSHIAFCDGQDIIKIVKIQKMNFDRGLNIVRSSENYDFEILNHIEQNPDTTQADLATQLGVAVGSVNWYIKRLINKGYIKVSRMERRRLRYLLTPQGISERARLTKEFMRMSLHWYRVTRQDSKDFLEAIKQAGYDTVCIEGDGDLAEIVYLSCLEAGVVVRDEVDESYPVFRIENWRVMVEWPAEDKPKAE